MSLPRTIEGLTPGWLTAALGSRHPGVVVTSVTIDKIIWGTATKILMTLEYGGQAPAGGPPRQLCVKGEFDERVRQAVTGVTLTGTQIEADFFHDLAPQLGIPLLRHWYSASEPGMGILILDNMSAVGTQFGTPTQPWKPELVAPALDILARLHASTWGKRFPGVAWLKVGSPAVREYNEFLMSETHWSRHFPTPGVFQLPAALQDRERSLGALRALWVHDDATANCLIHGDAHLGNTCIDADGKPFFIDWAGPCYSNWAFDVSYFIAGSMTVADRRHAEKDLFHHYLAALKTQGGPALDPAEAWLDYRRHHLNGLCWTTLPATMQSNENVHAMGERYAAAIVDHDSVRVMGQ